MFKIICSTSIHVNVYTLLERALKLPFTEYLPFKSKGNAFYNIFIYQIITFDFKIAHISELKKRRVLT